MKIVHAADLHLDSPLRGLDRYEGAPVDRLRGATRRAFTRLVELCLAEEAAALLLAGDLFDGAWLNYETGLFFARELARLRETSTEVVWVRGNHDAARRSIARTLTAAAHVTELPSDRVGTWIREPLGLAVHGQGYAHEATTEDLAARYPDPIAGLVNVGLLHTSLDGRPGHDAYAPTRPETLRQKGYDYWALGHVHAREVVCESPWIVFPGNLQGRHARELGPKGATVLDVRGPGRVTIEPRELDVVRWSELVVTAARGDSTDDLLDAARAALEAARDAAGPRLAAVRVRLRGESAVDGALRSDPARWEGELRRLANELGDEVFLEKILVETRPRRDPCRDPAAESIVRELVELLDELERTPASLAELGRPIAELCTRLPAELRAEEDLADLRGGASTELLREVRASLLARLEPDGEAP